MADLDFTKASQMVSITGADSTGLETNVVNSDSNGNLLVKDYSNGTVSPGTAAPVSKLIGGQYNSSLPTATTGQQVAVQLDANGRVIVSPLTNSSVVKAQLQDNSGTAITVGQKTMASSLPVVLSSDQSTLPISAASLPLPTGAATAANQSTMITSLQLLDNAIGPVTPGAVGTNSLLIGGQYNATAPSLTDTQQAAIQLDLKGRQLVTAVLTDSYKATYSASIISLVFANTATDIFTLTGSASKTIRILRVGFIATQTTAAIRDIVLLKRSTANTGGTFTNPTRVPLDSTNAAATATVNAYTVNPTSTGTLVGNIRTYKAYINTTSNAPNSYEWIFGDKNGQAIVLRGTAEVFAINMNSVTSAGNLCDIFIEWSEE